ncbi:metal ABC transporter solute-binding protein, Zn/Mn family [Microbacterium soli]|uniref:Zinc ABC transporter substrate-binding protein n=1 Tax=Microbacterium soli TaxID=446075 RepID=A0ABP7N3F5_9MICO
MQRSFIAIALTAASVIALSGCSSAAPAKSTDGTVQIVASTNVYGSLAAVIGGDRVTVTSLIDSTAKDPHSYEATARDRLAVQRADLVIENGGGYDSFMTQLRDGSDAEVITAAEFAHDHPDAAEGEDHDHEAEADHGHDHDAEDDHDHGAGHGHDEHGHSHIEGFNEHVWFDPDIIAHVAERVTADLTELDPAGGTEFAANAKALTAELDAIDTEIAALHGSLEGVPVLITEPLPGRLAAAVGLDDVTPEGFASAVEEGNDVAPATLLDALSLIDGGEVRAVLANAQTGGSETSRVEDAAQQAGIPVITFSELLEPEQSYAEWMRVAISDLAALEK